MSHSKQVASRERISVRGIVQGVGFRPFVYRLARRHSLGGWVLNDPRGVEIEVEGATGAIEKFVEGLKEEAPPLSKVKSVSRRRMEALGEREFVIRASVEKSEKTALVSPDCRTCGDCLRELFEPSDRRHRYPFINCTNCGPRYSIIRGIPYDRPLTSMAKFKMCAECRKEYDDPADRRFHAQPNACRKCGPKVTLLGADGAAVAKEDEAIKETARLLRRGKIAAVKGLGGFHLAVDATNEAAVRRLRKRKFREAKPLAVMVRSLEAARRMCEISEVHARLLGSVEAPIVLCPKRPGAGIAESVAPRSRNFGVMLPYTPLHHLILAEGFEALVMTSGNQTDEPIAIDNDEAQRRLGGIADAFLVHDREIVTRADDSVVSVMGGAPVMIRRSRGYVPTPLELPGPTPLQMLAVGAEDKNTICLVKGECAFVGQHIGDLKTEIALGFFEEVIEKLGRLLEIAPAAVAHDLHPGYMSTAYAREKGFAKRVGVQHHHAHVASCMAEHSLEGRVIGLAFDGTGYGTDGTIWGGELLIADYAGFERLGHLAATPMPGGDRCVEMPDRMAFSFLYSAYGNDAAGMELGAVKRLDQTERQVLVQMLEKGVSAPLSSGMGRLFDCVSALLDICPRPSFDGQAPMELEYFTAAGEEGQYPVELSKERPFVCDPRPVVRAVVEEVGKGVPREIISARFHNSIARLCVEMSLAAKGVAGLDRVMLSGGVFQNQYLTEKVLRALGERGFNVFMHSQVPPNDGCVSLGQAAIVRERLSR